MKPKTIKAFYSQENVNAFTRLIISSGLPYKISLSNYSAKIESPLYNVSFSKNTFSIRLFAAYQSLKKDVSAHTPPNIEDSKVRYYNIKPFAADFYADRINNTDINSAYACILHNAGYISKETFTRIMKLPKVERLACLGMIASRKEIYHMNKKNEVEIIEDINNPLSPFFYFCADKTFNIMEDVRVNILQGDFLFSWVDGIYYNQGPTSKINAVIESYLKEVYGLDCKHKELTEFQLKAETEIYRMTFQESGKLKSFAIPKPESQMKRDIINHLINKHKKND